MSAAATPSPILTAVIGFGLSATVFHLPFIQDNPAFQLSSILVRSSSATAAAVKSHPSPVTVVSSYQEILSNPAISLVVLTTPPDTHFSYARDAILAGKHVVIEKPLCPTWQEAEELDRLSREAGVTVAVYQNRRFDSDFLTLRDVLAAGSLGHVVEYEANFDRFRVELKDGGASWKEHGELPGTGLLYDLGSHLIDQALVLFGTPRSVTGTLLRQRPGTSIDDGFHVVLHYENGLVATLRAGMLIAAPRPRFAVFGTQGSFVKHGLDVQEPQLRAGMTLNDPGFAIEPAETSAVVTVVGKDGKATVTRPTTRPGDYRQFYRLLGEAISKETEPPVSLVSVSKVIRIIQLAYQSHQEQRTVPFS